jgi:hypothetical protein
MKEFLILLSTLLVSGSGLYFVGLVWTRKIPTNAVSWGVWSIIGVSLFVTSGASFGFNSVTFITINPFLVTIAGTIRQWEKKELPTKAQTFGGVLGLLSMLGWFLANEYGAPAEWTLMFSILADCIPLVPIINDSWQKPQDDRPVAWVVFALGFACMFLGLTEYTLYTMALPLYMIVGPSLVAVPLVRYRLQTQAPLREWF